jgi:molybdopterin adenylyltransferase
MSSSTPNWSTAAVITVSDSCARRERDDLSGPAVTAILRKRDFSIVGSEIVADDEAAIEKAMLHWASQSRLVVTTGGTGVAARDVTPEATRRVCQRFIEGVAERMRFEGAKKTEFAALSRGLCGVRGETLILNVPGSPTAAVESLESVIDLLPHALRLLAGKIDHP